MAYPEDTNGVIVRVVPRSPAVPPGTVTTSDWADHEARLTTLEAGYDLGDLNNVDETGATDGQTLIRSGTGYVLGQVDGTIASVQTWDTGTAAYEEVATDVITLFTNTGITSRQGSGSPNFVVIEAAFAGTGSDDTIARSDHYHTTASIARTTTSPSGYLSSGSRSLGSQNVTLLDGVRYLVLGVLTGQMRGADAGAAYYRLSVTIAGTTRQSPAGSDGFWCVQGVPDKYTWDHAQTITGTGAAITVSASVDYSSGAGFNVDYSELEVRLIPRS